MSGTIQERNSLSVVIPTLNAVRELPMLLPLLTGAPLVREIVVSDGGSHDATRCVAEKAGARVVSAARGRGTQLAAGANATTTEWLLFLHADCRPGPGWEDAVVAFSTAPDARECAGYFALVLDDDAPAARRLERIVAWRCRWLGLPYGDQGLLISRDLYDALGGFAPIPLMEDVEFVRRIGRQRLRPLGAPIIASAGRYRRDGYIRRPLWNLLCLSLYFAGVPPVRIARLYNR
jgi:rSAM/selenodomain-associated transferase 2